MLFLVDEPPVQGLVPAGPHDEAVAAAMARLVACTRALLAEIAPDARYAATPEHYETKGSPPQDESHTKVILSAPDAACATIRISVDHHPWDGRALSTIRIDDAACPSGGWACDAMTLEFGMYERSYGVSTEGWTGSVANLIRTLGAGFAYEPSLQRAFVSSAFYGGIDVLDELLATGLDVNEPDPVGDLALVWACRRDDPDWVRWLLERGACPNTADGSGHRPLTVAAGRNPRAVHLLLEAGADVHAHDRWGGTAMHSLLQSASKDCAAGALRALVAAGLGANEGRDHGGQTPLMRAAAVRIGPLSLELSRILLAAGADPSAPGRDGRIWLDYAPAQQRDGLAALVGPSQA